MKNINKLALARTLIIMLGLLIISSAIMLIIVKYPIYLFGFIATALITFLVWILGCILYDHQVKKLKND